MPDEHVRSADPDTNLAIEHEKELQQTSLMMIASENIATHAIQEAQGSVLTNRNALGYPGSRLYPGAENIDEIESLAIEYAKDLWGADHVNVQPHSGSLANLAVYLAVLEPGDTILSLDPSDGGHITHGSDLHVSGDLYDTEYYHLNTDTGRLDYDEIAQRAEAVDPDMIISGYSTYPREIDWQQIQETADTIDAYHLADIAHLSGLIAADHYPSPVGVADFCTGSTYKTIRTGRGGFILSDEEYAEAIDTALFPRLQGGAAMPNIAGKAVGFAEALEPTFTEYIDRVVANARSLAASLTDHNIRVLTGGTDTHIVLIDLQDSHCDLAGSEAEQALETAGVIANKASVPNDPRQPSDASGLRFGTTSLTAQGFTESDMESVAEWIACALDNVQNEPELKRIATEVESLCQNHQ